MTAIETHTIALPEVSGRMEMAERSTEVFSEDADRVLNKLRDVSAMDVIIDSNMKVITLCDEYMKNSEPPEDPNMQKGYFRSLNRMVQNANNAKKLLISLFVPMVAIKAKTIEKDGSMAINVEDLQKSLPRDQRAAFCNMIEGMMENKELTNGS